MEIENEQRLIKIMIFQESNRYTLFLFVSTEMELNDVWHVFQHLGASALMLLQNMNIGLKCSTTVFQLKLEHEHYL